MRGKGRAWEGSPVKWHDARPTVVTGPWPMSMGATGQPGPSTLQALNPTKEDSHETQHCTENARDPFHRHALYEPGGDSPGGRSCVLTSFDGGKVWAHRQRNGCRHRAQSGLGPIDL